MTDSQLLSVSEEGGNRIDDNYLDEVVVDLDSILRRKRIVWLILIEETMEFRSSDVLDSGIPPQDPRKTDCMDVFPF